MMHGKLWRSCMASLSLLLCTGLVLAPSMPSAGVPSEQTVSPGQGAPQGADEALASAKRSKKIKEQKQFASDSLLVRFKPGVTEERARNVHKKVKAELERQFRAPKNLHLVKVPKGIKLETALRMYKEDPDVLYAEPDYVYEVLAVPNDPSLSSLWGLHNTGQTGGIPDADINAPEAWDLTTGSTDTIIAVIDTGVDYTHQDLAANIWTNPGEIPGNGIDDDNNGYIDDIHGINAITNTGNPMDDHNHGTHVSGTIAAVGNNGIGVVGVNWNAKIMACKFLNSGGSGYSSDAVKCLDYFYALKTRSSNPVNILLSSNSWGGGGYSQALSDAIDANRSVGILFVAAAGNSALNADTYPHYPSSYFLPNVISVAATDHADALASFSNYGRYTVHVGAPGVNVLSTTIGNTYSSYNGTSMATPHVSGLIGLLNAQDPSRDWKTLKNLVLAGGQNKQALTGKTVTGKRIRAAEGGGIGSLSCVDQAVGSRLQPIGTTISAAKGQPLGLSFLNINCGQPNGEVTVTASDGTSAVLTDDGMGMDQEEGDGIYSGQWTPSQEGDFTLTFPGNDVITIRVAKNYQPAVPTNYHYRTFTGTALTMWDDSVSTVTLPFPIPFGGSSAGFTALYVSSNGNVSFSTINSSYSNSLFPTASFQDIVAPFWDDLNPGAGGGIYWTVLGSAPNREVVVEWRNVPHYSYSGGAVTFQAVFFEGSSDILFNYKDVMFGDVVYDSGASATVGVQVGSTLAQQYSYNAPSLVNETALLWKMDSLKANAGPDQFTLPGAVVQLDGSGSSNAGGAITGYSWIQTGGTPVMLTGADTVTPSFTAPETFETLSFELTVTADSGETASDSVSVIVNLPPVANAGPDQIALANFPVTLNGAGSSDPNGSITSYQWVQTAGTSVILSGADTATPGFTATSTPGTLTFQLTVTDNSGQTASDMVNVLVQTPPVANAGPDQFAQPGAVVTLNGTGSYDPDGTITGYAWLQTAGINVELTGANTAAPSFTAPVSSGTVALQLTVTDDHGYSSVDAVSVIVNVPPLSNAGPDQAVPTNAAVLLDGTGSHDPDGTIVGYHWVQTAGTSVALSGADTATPGFTASSTSGTLTFQLTVTDNSGQAASDVVNVVVQSAPVANAGTDQAVGINAVVTLSGTGSYDPDGTITSYLWEQTAGEPVTLTGAGTATASFTAPANAGTLTFRLAVTDNSGYTASDTVDVRVMDTYQPAVVAEYIYRTFTGTKLSMSDDTVVTITSPFPIRFGDHPEGLTSLNVSSNGTISFTTSTWAYWNGALPTTIFQDVIAPFWDDLYPPSGDGVYWAVLGTAPNRELVVEWRSIPHISYSSSGAGTFQVVFFENSSNILFNYADVIFGGSAVDGGASATVGIQSARDLARQFSYNTPSLTNNLALLWRARLAPAPHAGPDQFVLPGVHVVLDGTGSTAPGGSIVSYQWEQTAGTPVELTGANTATASFTSPTAYGTLAFKLTIVDDQGRTAGDSVNVIVNLPPVADAGPDQTVLAGTPVTLNGAGSSDPNGSITGYQWVQTAGASVSLSGADTATPGFTATSTPGTLTFRLTVTDDSGQTASDTVSVLVRTPPVANAGPDQFAQPGASVTLDGTGSSDPDGVITSYAWLQTAGPAVALTGADTATPSFTAPAADTLTFQLTVTDDHGYSGVDSVSVVINVAPTADAGPDQTILTGTSVSMSGAGSSDPDGTIISYQWVQTTGTYVTLTGADTSTPGFTAPSYPGTLTFQLTVTDNSGQTASDTVNILVQAVPVANAGPDLTVITGGAASLNGAGSYDPDGTITIYQWEQTAGVPVTITGANTATASFTAPATTDTLSFRLSVTDNSGYTTSDTVDVQVLDAYKPAEVTEYAYRAFTGTKLAMSDDTVVTITSPFPIRFGDHPEGLTSLNVSSNGTISFTTASWAFWNGTLPTTIFQDVIAPFWDDLYPPSGDGVYWAVLGTAPNRELVVEWRNVPHISYSSGSGGTFQVVFFENSSDILFNYADVIFGSSAVDAGASATVGLQVTQSAARQFSYNTASLSDQLALLWKTNYQPLADAGPDQIVLAASTVALDGTGSSDPDGTVSSYQWTQTGGTTVALTGADTATPRFTAPDVSDTLAFQLTVTDNKGATATDTVNIIVNLPPTAVPGENVTVLAGSSVLLNGTGSFDPDGSITAYAWTQVSGAGVSLSGANSATPSFTAPMVSGMLVFDLTVQDDRGASANALVSIIVNLPPIANAGSTRSVRTNSAVILNGSASSDPDGTIVSYSWLQTAGPLVTLTGADTTTPSFTAPSTEAALTFQLTVTDDRGATASSTVLISAVANIAPVADAGSDQVVKSKSTVALNGTKSNDPDGSIISYSWTQLTGTSVVLTGANTSTPRFTAPNTSEALTFRLTVTDNEGASAADEVRIIVTKSGTL